MKRNLLQKPIHYSYNNAAFILIIINVVVFFFTYMNQRLIFYIAMIPNLVVQEGFFWQVFTYMFAHANFSHIFFNMLGLFFFGVQIERRMGTGEFLLFYGITGTLAGVFSLFVYLLTGNTGVILLGASGAVFAVLLAFATYFPYARIYIFGIIPMRAPVLVVVYTGIELFSQVTSSYSGVAHLTHLAGFGFAYLYFLLRLNINPVDIWRRSGRGPWG
ncbi:MAG: rhomboid family intramembrane serine protease [Spirochaetales bacterium]|nr:rhomboid family intramembrane serine protease [Spirochaetales bacterium]